MSSAGAREDLEPAGPPRPLRIGLTGPIGCGKSTIAGWLRAWGGAVVDADALAREVTRPGEPAHDAVLERFGDPVRAADGTLDRAALAAIAFRDPGALATLEAIVHPVVRPRILAAIAAAERDDVQFVALEAIKLIESGYGPICDEVWLVTCDRDRQRERLVARGSSPVDAERRMAAQHGLAERLAPAATRVIDTSGPRDVTASLVAAALTSALAHPRGATGRAGRG